MIMQAHLLGAIMGIIFVAAIGMPLFLVWHKGSAAKAYGPRRQLRPKGCKLLVPITDAMPAEWPMELARRLRWNQSVELLLVYVIVVPFTLNLDAPLPELDRAANEALDRAHAIAEKHGHRPRLYLVRQRNAAEGILQVARDEQVDAIVLEVGAAGSLPADWRRTGAEILSRSECEVIVDKVPATRQPIAAPA